jgi:hypothetical protein
MYADSCVELCFRDAGSNCDRNALNDFRGIVPFHVGADDPPASVLHEAFHERLFAAARQHVQQHPEGSLEKTKFRMTSPSLGLSHSNCSNLGGRKDGRWDVFEIAGGRRFPKVTASFIVNIRP